MSAVNNVGMWHRWVEKGIEALENAWRYADLRQSNMRRQREASGSRAASATSANSDSVTITALDADMMELTERVARFAVD